MNQTHVLTSAQSEISRIDSSIRERRPLPAVRPDALHVVCVCVNRIGKEQTYFGDAFFDRALRSTHNLHAAFELAAQLVADWENAGDLTSSEPQVALGMEIEPVLEQLASEAEGL